MPCHVYGVKQYIATPCDCVKCPCGEPVWYLDVLLCYDCFVKYSRIFFFGEELNKYDHD